MELNGCHILTMERCKTKTKGIMFSLIRHQSNWRCTLWSAGCIHVQRSCNANTMHKTMWTVIFYAVQHVQWIWGHIFSCDVYAPSVGWGCHTLLSQEVVSWTYPKPEKWFTVFWPTIRFIWFDCCYNMLDFQKCGVLCNQWEVPLQICVLEIDVSHPLFAQTLHQRSKLAKCTFSKIYLKDFLHLNWISCYISAFLNSTFYGSIRHWPSHLWSMVYTCHALSSYCSCQLWFLWHQQSLKQSSRDIYILFCNPNLGSSIAQQHG